jgi:hypothetical protein
MLQCSTTSTRPVLDPCLLYPHPPTSHDLSFLHLPHQALEALRKDAKVSSSHLFAAEAIVAGDIDEAAPMSRKPKMCDSPIDPRCGVCWRMCSRPIPSASTGARLVAGLALQPGPRTAPLMIEVTIECKGVPHLWTGGGSPRSLAPPPVPLPMGS